MYVLDRVEVRLGALPSEWPADVTIPAGAGVVGGVTRRRDGAIAAMSAYLEGAPSGAQILEHYERVLAPPGWVRFEQQSPPHLGTAGFRSAAPSPASIRLFCRTETDPFYSVQALESGGGAVVTWDAGLDHHPLRMRAGPYGPGGPLGRLIPDLPAPANVPVQGGGGGGSDTEWEIRARAHTALPARDLARHYRDALVRAGWTMRDEGGGDVVAWSRWKLAEDDYEAMFVVAEALAELRDLTLVIRSPSRASRGWRMWSAGVSRFAG